MRVIKKYKYLIAYLALIPLYATIYSCFPKEFNSSILETKVDENVQTTLNKNLSKWIQWNIASVYKDSIKTSKGVKFEGIDVDSFHLLNMGRYSILLETINAEYIGVSADTLFFSINTTMNHKDFDAGKHISIPSRFKDSTTDKLYEKPMNLSYSCSFKAEVKIYNDSQFTITSYDRENIEDRLCFPISFYDVFVSNIRYEMIGKPNYYKAFMQADEDFINDLRTFINPKYPFSNFLYLSAITITTVGFGDITPTSKRSKFFVVTEAILGVLLIGFFFYSLDRKR